ncbi:MAG: F0F1 ATP synthase subunit B [Thermaerobacter sp.]|nr:F0F1 ATP synthase subunit B [Thermaerobacter sp.]
MLGLNVGTFIAEVVSFLLFLWLMSKFAFPPIEKILNDRRERIEGAIGEARRDREEAARLKEQFEAQIESARQEAQALIERAQRTADLQAQETIQSARQEAERLVAMAREEIDGEKREALREIRREVADLSLAIAGRVLQEELDGARQRKLVDEFLSTAESGS